VTPDRLAAMLRAIIPDPFVIALLLTGVALVSAGALQASAGTLDALGLARAWVAGAPLRPGGPPMGGLWSLLAFSMQMCLILVTGYAVAGTPLVRGGLRRLAAIPSSARSGVVLVAAVAMALGLVHWGLGLISGALLAREVGRSLHFRGIVPHYPALAAAGYAGLAVWHGGLSGSAPLKVTTLRDLSEVLGADLAASVGVIPLTATVLSPRNLLVNAALFLVVPSVLAVLVPTDETRRVPMPAGVVEDPREDAAAGGAGIAGWLDRSPILGWALAALVAAWAIPWAGSGGLTSLNPDHLNLLFFAGGLVLAGSPARYMRLAEQGASACAGILVQFPLYGGILGLLVAGGALERIASQLPSGEAPLAVTTLLSAGLINLLVPSGGGQWAIQGPIILQAAEATGIAPGRLVLALAWGDQWTNLFQPFWALPLLGITGARAGDLLSHTAVLGVVVGLVLIVGIAVG